MQIKKKTSNEPRPSEITGEQTYRNRRRFLKVGAVGAVAGLGAVGASQALDWSRIGEWLGLSDAPSPAADAADPGALALTPYEDVTSYNNFYEFGTAKTDPKRYAGSLVTRPWEIVVDGECDRPGTLGIEDLLAAHAAQERIYRLRCVETWSMVIPWLGIPLADVLKTFAPNSRAKYVAFTTLYDPEQMRAQRSRILDWPYVEGLRIDEAMHPLTLLATGLYGKDLPNQNGAPLRLVVPWKYGFKSIKSIVRISFTERQPPTTWNIEGPREYGFYANVNPAVDHPRWSQARERRIGEFLKRPTLPFNGYADEVAALYSGMDLARNF